MPQAPATALADGTRAIKASEVDPTTQIERLSAGELSVTIDTAAPAQPTFSGSTPASPASTTTPTVKGSAEAGATVNLYTDVVCTAPAAAWTGGIAALAYGVLPP